MMTKENRRHNENTFVTNVWHKLMNKAASCMASMAVLALAVASCHSGNASDDEGDAFNVANEDTCMYSKEFYVGADLSSSGRLPFVTYYSTLQKKINGFFEKNK